jgi:hypothetical protein
LKGICSRILREDFMERTGGRSVHQLALNQYFHKPIADPGAV